jgi:hypothetical protein
MYQSMGRHWRKICKQRPVENMHLFGNDVKDIFKNSI